MSGFIYLASPYWHPDETIRLARVVQTKQKVAELLCQGFIIYSPIVHNHQLARLLPEEIRHNHDFWMGIDLPFLSRAKELWILCLDGWEASRGISDEVAHARSLSISILYLKEGAVSVDPTLGTNRYIREQAAQGILPGSSAGTRG